MIWIVSKALVTSEELVHRHQFIQEITQARVSPWSECNCKSNRWPYKSIGYYCCTSDKGEYGFFITAHMNLEVQPILQQVLSQKKALVVINSCAIQKSTKIGCARIVAEKSPRSEVFYIMNYLENAGEFGFRSTVSERELFQHRRFGLVKAIRTVYEKVMLE